MVNCDTFYPLCVTITLWGIKEPADCSSNFTNTRQQREGERKCTVTVESESQPTELIL